MKHPCNNCSLISVCFTYGGECRARRLYYYIKAIRHPIKSLLNTRLGTRIKQRFCKHMCMDHTDLKHSKLAQDFNKSHILCDHFKDKLKYTEVKHGEWLINSDGYYPYCSECRTEPKNGIMSKYCPECGAIMKGLKL